MRSLPLTVITLLAMFITCRAGFYVPDLPPRRYIREGDINLGAIFPIGSYSKTEPCGKGLRSTVIVQFIEALVFAVNEINNDSSILPDINLGFVILDDCLKETTTVAQTLSFIPQVDSCEDTCSANTSQPLASPRYDVVGVVGSLKSSNSISAASILGPVHVPQISYSSTSDELSNKVLYPYFMRVVPPDEFQTEAIVSLIAMYGWSYISVVYSAGSYGELGYKNIKRLTDQRGICIGAAIKVDEGLVSKEYHKIAQELLNNSNARVVVIFAGPAHAKGVLKALKEIGSSKKFIFIGSDAWAKRIKNLGEFWEVALGAFTVSFYSVEVPEYTEYFKTLRPNMTQQDPWFREFWESHFSCSLNSSSSNPCDSNNVLSSSNGFYPVPTVTPVMDAVSTFARALHDLLNDHCPGMNVSEARSCVTGPLLLQYLKNTSFIGRNGLIKFDENGNELGRYMIDQLVRGDPYTQIKVATYDALTKTIKVNNPVTWEYIEHYYNSTPESVCSKPCGPREFLIQMELTCCWECKLCRSNEIVTYDRTNCIRCPVFTWPDSKKNYTTCSVIRPTTMTWKEPLAIMLMAFASFGLLCSIAVTAFYIKNNQAKCIKASSRELSFLMLVGVYVGYLTVFGLLTKPDDMTCQTNFFFFCLSFTWIYGPLLTRTTRIYRIFESGKKSNKRLGLISPLSQFIIANTIIFGQIIISSGTLLLVKPGARKTMPVLSQKYVEETCDFTTPGVAAFLIYNLILVLACAVFAFKTRRLPDNFNESRFISMCVYTTLIIWLAFMSTYFTAGREYLKTLTLSIALLLNGTVVLLFLYVPKIYATVCLQGVVSGTSLTGRSTGQTFVNDSSSCNITKVQPVSDGKEALFRVN